jgi:hypothetical protein
MTMMVICTILCHYITEWIVSQVGNGLVGMGMKDMSFKYGGSM